MRKWFIRLAILAVLVLAGVILKLTVLAAKPIAVTVVRIETGRVEATVTNSKAGTVKARERAKLAPELGGRVVALPHAEGERVKAGEVLLQIDDTAARAQLTLAQRGADAAGAERDRACLAAEQAVRELERNKSLAAQGIVSADILDRLESAAATAGAACAAARAGVAQAEAGVEAARVELLKTTLKAPFDGVLAEVSIHLGEWATPSPPGIPMPAVLDVINTKSIYISAPMDEVDSHRVESGQPTRVTLDPFPKQSFAGRLSRVAPYVLDVETQNRTVEIEVELEDAAFAATLLPGTSADVEVILDVSNEVVRVPAPTLLEGGAVLVVEKGLLVKRKLELGLRNWNYAEVVKGLVPGDLVVNSLDRPGVVAGAKVVVEEGSQSP